MITTQINKKIEGKEIKREIISDKNNSYLITFSLEDSLSIQTIQTNNIFYNSFSNKYNIQKIQENKYFIQFNNIKEIFEELKERIKNKIILFEKDNNLIISISLSSTKTKEVKFELNKFEKIENEKINDLLI